MSKFDYIKKEIEQLKAQNLYRSIRCVENSQGPVVQVAGREKMVFCSNNYLNLANHQAIIRAAAETMKKFGYGAAASRLISGTMKPHIKVEQKVAEILHKEAALFFPSGWMANEAVIKTIPQKADLLLIDKQDHASIIDAARSSQAQFRTYRRDDFARLERFLADGKYNRCFIITESIFSMDGHAANLKKLVKLKNRYQAFLIVDEAHAFGCLGPNGAGLAEELGLLDEVDIIVVTMGKALGATGAAVASEKSVIELLVNKARSFIYTTATSPVTCAAVLAALDIMKKEPRRRENLKANAQYLRDRLNRIGLDTGKSTSHIIPVIIGGEKEALAVAEELFKRDFFIPAIRPPTVPQGTARLRISVQAEHTPQQMDALCDALEDLLRKGFFPVLSNRH